VKALGQIPELETGKDGSAQSLGGIEDDGICEGEDRRAAVSEMVRGTYEDEHF
jgi:hypothetical protein